MAAAIVWDNDLGGGVLALDSGNRIAQGDRLVTEMLMSLGIDAPADSGDPVPEGVTRLGNWEASFVDSTIRGSKLWMCRYVKPVSRLPTLAAGWASDALQWLVDAGKLLSVETTAAVVDRRVEITIRVVLTDGAKRTFIYPFEI